MPVKEIDTEEKIANLEDKIFNLTEQLNKKKNAAARKAARKQIKLLERKLQELYGFNDLALGDWVCNGSPDIVGQIVELKQEKEIYQAWVIWENEIVPKPNSPSTLTKQNPDDFIWQWDNEFQAIIRCYDNKECDDFEALYSYREILERSLKTAQEESLKVGLAKQLFWIQNRWSTVTKDKFRKGDRVKYNQKNATVIEYQIQGELLFCWLKFEDQEELLVSPRELERTGVVQPALKVEPETYPCIEEIAIASITREPTLQQRVKLDPPTVQEYAELLQQGEELEPVQIVLDQRGNYWLWDGFHTIEAHNQNQETFIKARITLGTYDDAFKLSLGANAKRGLKLSREDKHNKVKNALLANLTDEKGKPLSNRAIAEICCVSHSMVNDVKKQLFPPKIEPEQPKTIDLIESSSEPTSTEKSPPLTKNPQPSPSNLETQEAEEPQTIKEALQTSPSNDNQAQSSTEIEQTKNSGRSSTELEQVEVISGVSSDEPGNMTVYINEDIVYIKKTSADKRLVGYLGSAAMILENHSHSVDLLFWGENIIKNVAKDDISLMTQKVNILARIPTKQLAILIQKFKTPEDAIAKFTDSLTTNEF